MRRPSCARFTDTFRQMWGALLVGPFIFDLVYVFNYTGMANTMANGSPRSARPTSCLPRSFSI